MRLADKLLNVSPNKLSSEWIYMHLTSLSHKLTHTTDCLPAVSPAHPHKMSSGSSSLIAHIEIPSVGAAWELLRFPFHCLHDAAEWRLDVLCGYCTFR